MSDVSVEVREAAGRAAAMIRQRGWYQGAFMGPSGGYRDCPVCAGGAVNIACGSAPDDVPDAALPVYAAIIDAATNHDVDPDEHLDELVEIVGAWNDSPHRTGAEVLAVLDEIAGVVAVAA